MSRRLRCGRVLASTLLLALILIFYASPALALYLFLDSNGDAARSAADVLSPHDTTHVAVWLVTDEYKPGTSDDCSHGRYEEAHSYSIVFHATGGTVTWGRFVPDPSPYEETFAYNSDDSTYFMVSRNIPDWGTTHKLRLGTFTAFVQRGRPSIEIASRRPMQPYEETRITTGTWDGPFAACADGLPYGGQANRPPSLGRFADQPIRAATSERLIMEATDPDGDPLAFRLTRGPSFVSVSTLDPGHGVAQGVIRVEPDSCAQGPAECVVEVSDGFASVAGTMLLNVKPIVRPLPSSPMQAPPLGTARTIPQDRSPVDSTWLAGEWEWHETSVNAVGDLGRGRERTVEGPGRRGYRRRLIFHRNGELEMFEIGPEKVLRALKGTFSIASVPQGTLLTIFNWLDALPDRKSVTFAASKKGPSSLSMNSWEDDGARTETFVRVPAVGRDGVPTDTGRVIAPIDTPKVRLEHGRVQITLPEPMKAALRRQDPTFQLWGEADSRELNPGPSKDTRALGPSAIVGDFDGDLLRDVALLGRSGADQVVIAILSDHGNIGGRGRVAKSAAGSGRVQVAR